MTIVNAAFDFEQVGQTLSGAATIAHAIAAAKRFIPAYIRLASSAGSTLS